MLFISSCTSPETGPRFEHEGPKSTQPMTTEDSLGVLDAFDLDSLYAYLQKNSEEQYRFIIEPLSYFILNPDYIEVPEFRTRRMTEMLSIFNHAFMNILNDAEISMDLKQKIEGVKKSYYERVFSGCSPDLRSDCTNLSIFERDHRSYQILYRIADQVSEEIRKHQANFSDTKSCIRQDEKCRNLIFENYRLLSAAVSLNSSLTKDQEFLLAFSRNIRALAYLYQHEKEALYSGQISSSDLLSSYLGRSFENIFSIIMGQYADNQCDEETLVLISGFQSWLFSLRQQDVFSSGSRHMFEVAARCTLYENNNRGRNLTEPLREAIRQSQRITDDFGISFLEMTKSIDPQIFKNFDMTDVAQLILSEDSRFFDENFYLIDRLFREHWQSQEAGVVMRHMKLDDLGVSRLLSRARTYFQINLLFMVMQTNEFIKNIYKSGVGSEKIFEETLLRSREISVRWSKIQTMMSMVDTTLGATLRLNVRQEQQYERFKRFVESVNRNIHFLSVYPNKMVLSYFLLKTQGGVNSRSWWGFQFTIDADKSLENLYSDGFKDELWFRFGQDLVFFNREMLFYAMYYALSTQTLESFVDVSEGALVSPSRLIVGEENRNVQNNNENIESLTQSQASLFEFFDLTVSRYLEPIRRELHDAYSEINNKVFSSPHFFEFKQICDYEMAARNGSFNGQVPERDIKITELHQFTYAGIGSNGLTSVSTQFFSGEIFNYISKMKNSYPHKIIYMNTMLDILENHLKDQEDFELAGAAENLVLKLRQHIKNIEWLKARILGLYISNYEWIYECHELFSEIERRRAHRLYDEERNYLRWLHSIWTEALQENDEKRRRELLDIVNAQLGAQPGARFDRVQGETFTMSKHDLLMRMKDRIEKDIFINPTEREREVFADSLLLNTVARPVVVSIPPGFERSSMVLRAENQPISYHPDPEIFVQRAMLLLSGRGGTYIEWRGQAAKSVVQKNYLSRKVDLYILGEVSTVESGSWCPLEEFPDCAKSHNLSARELLELYRDFVKSLDMDILDIESAKEFQSDGRFDVSFFENFLLERGSRQSQSLLWYLSKLVYDQAELTTSRNHISGTARHFSDTIRGLGLFIFEPQAYVKDSIQKNYSQAVNLRLGQVQNFFREVDALIMDSSRLQSFNALFDISYRVEEGRVRTLRNSARGGTLLVQDRLYESNFTYYLNEFIQQTSNIYGTRESVRDPIREER